MLCYILLMIQKTTCHWGLNDDDVINVLIFMIPCQGIPCAYERIGLGFVFNLLMVARAMKSTSSQTVRTDAPNSSPRNPPISLSKLRNSKASFCSISSKLNS